MSAEHAVTLATISASGAQSVLDAAREKAADLNAPATVAVVDAGGLLKAMMRMDDAPLVGVDLARQKAYTALAMGPVDTADLVEALKERPHLLAALASLPDLALLPGGVVLRVTGVIVGAVGVSAPSGGADGLIAAAAAQAVAGQAV